MIQALRRVPPSVHGGLVMAAIGAFGRGGRSAVALSQPRAPHRDPVGGAGASRGARVVAAALAVLASMALQTLARARHAPAQATTLLIVVGALDADLHGAFVFLAGVALVAILGEGVRRLKLAAAIAA